MNSLWIWGAAFLIIYVWPRVAEHLGRPASSPGGGERPVLPPSEPEGYDHPDLGEVVYDPEGPSLEIQAPLRETRVRLRMTGVSALVGDFVLLQHLSDHLEDFERRGRQACIRAASALAQEAGRPEAGSDLERFSFSLALEVMTTFGDGEYELRFTAGDLLGGRAIAVQGCGIDGPLRASLAG